MGSLAPVLRILDVGNGTSAVIEGDGNAILVDVGPGTTAMEYLREHELHSLGAVLISHADADHMGGLQSLIAAREIHIERIHLNTDSMQDSKLWGSIVWEIEAQDRAGNLMLNVDLTEGMSFELSRDVRLRVLAPRKALALLGPGRRDDRDRIIETNTMSAVIRVEVQGDAAAILTGDIDQVGLSHLLETGQDLRAPILVYPHHGGRPGRADDQETVEFAKELCSAIQPSVVIFSTGRSARGNPLPQVIRAIRSILPECRILCTQLSSHCASELTRPGATHLDSSVAAGRRRGQCCAGSMVLSLVAAEGIIPDGESHRAFIGAAAPTAMCLRQWAVPLPAATTRRRGR